MSYTCPSCGATIDDDLFRENFGVCPKCGYHFQIAARERKNFFCDKWEKIPLENNVLEDPLLFIDRIPYRVRVDKIRKKLSYESAIIIGKCWVKDLIVTAGFFDFDFLGGTMGVLVGERLRKLFDFAAENKLPVIIFFASGGARMQEGLFSLLQMAKVTVASSEFKKTSLPYISVVTHPTTGGVMASIAYQGDVVIAEPGADVGFTGKRVIRSLYGGKIPQGFQKAEVALQKGYIDAVVDRRELKNYITQIFSYLYK